MFICNKKTVRKWLKFLQIKYVIICKNVHSICKENKLIPYNTVSSQYQLWKNFLNGIWSNGQMHPNHKTQQQRKFLMVVGGGSCVPPFGVNLCPVTTLSQLLI